MTSVLVTRPTDSAAPLLRALGDAGFVTCAVPTVAREPVAPALGLRRALTDLAASDWLVVTSPHGADVVAPSIEALPPSSRPRIAVIGPSTGESLRSHGIGAAAIAADARPAALIASMAAHGSLGDRRVVVARSDAAHSELPKALTATGARVWAVVTYRTVIGPASSRGPLLDALTSPDTDAVTFASGSALRGLLVLAGAAASRLHALRIVTIGPATSAVVRDHGFHVAAEAARPDAVSQVAAVRAALSS